MTTARTTTPQYYAKVPVMLGFTPAYHWLELREANTLAAAQEYIDWNLYGAMEIGVSVNGAEITTVAKKDAEGKWS